MEPCPINRLLKHLKTRLSKPIACSRDGKGTRITTLSQNFGFGSVKNGTHKVVCFNPLKHEGKSRVVKVRIRDLIITPTPKTV